jgi:peptidoglycan/xylan/chitin deacetylase (PgdA/CDA1 family)
MYIPTAYVGETSRWMVHEGEGNRPLLSWQQIQEMNASGIECGAHSHTHLQLDLLSRLQANEEITLSKRILEDCLGQPVTSFAYPHGYYKAETQRLLRRAGYTSACTVKYAMATENTSAFALTRQLVEPTTDVQALATLLAGHNRRTIMSAYTRPLVPLWRYVRLYKDRKKS